MSTPESPTRAALLPGKVAVVTGGAGAIGRQICLTLAAEGAIVYCCDLDPDRCGQVVDAVHSAGGRAHALVGDIGDQATVESLFGTVRAGAGRLDVLVNGAAWIVYELIGEIAEPTIDRMITAGLKSIVWTTQQAIPLMRHAGGGSIVNISSSAGVRPARRQFVYSGIKGAVGSMTVQSAVELGPDGIRVNAVAPGLVVHDGNLARLSPAFIEARRADTPLGRLGRSEDIAGAVLFLASELSSFVSGQTITVDGGRLFAG
ncbi:SDR family NAD(P)-dependent oxidoreductase [Actinacidiphila sp. ITFR-21]|uniref:SDR family NAD(P)-dependent oxidoreductase n=1 Tax=Actinacidiphila sp. ITFR-21 TaxID=3075199 RepID=UPI00288B9BBD|nr:SDR family oxidoreductase [Streptomyces sp. ITFR-21]WNI18745.1 SDR family oxidoreductase [Streptomyces sp. ITFR-21]